MTHTHLPSLLRQLRATEQSWNAQHVEYPREDAVHFLPFPMAQFVSMLTDAVEAAPVKWSSRNNAPAVPAFLDVGCGPGTKAKLAQELFGLDAYGIDIVPSFVAEAQSLGVRAACADAFDFASYAAHDILFVNRPSTLQDELEKHIMKEMAGGAVLMAANWRHSPSEYGFVPVAIEYERPICGVWRKPLNLAATEEPARMRPQPRPARARD